MEAKQTKAASSVIDSPTDHSTQEGWVSPEVVAAENGQEVEFGKDLDHAEQDPTDA